MALNSLTKRGRHVASEKDSWDKIQAVGALLSGIAIPLLLFFASYKADALRKAADQSARELQQQAEASALKLQREADESARERALTQGDMSLRVSQASIIPPLIDGLLSADAKKRKLAISAILIALPVDGPKLVQELGAQSEDADVKSYAQKALSDRKEKLVADLYASDASTRTTAASALVTGWKNDGDIAKRVIDSAQRQPGNETGVYNSVVVLNGLSRNALAPHKSEVETFLKSASQQGAKTASQAQRVEAKLRAPESGAAE